LALFKRVKLTQELEEACEVMRLLKVGPSGLEKLELILQIDPQILKK